MDVSKLSQSKFDISLKKLTIVILGLSVSCIILELLSNQSNLFNILLLINIVAIAVVGGIIMVKIIKNTLKP